MDRERILRELAGERRQRACLQQRSLRFEIEHRIAASFLDLYVRQCTVALNGELHQNFTARSLIRVPVAANQIGHLPQVLGTAEVRVIRVRLTARPTSRRARQTSELYGGTTGVRARIAFLDLRSGVRL